jgi:hypothetical protein
MNDEQETTLPILSQRLGIPVPTLRGAAKSGRLEHRRVGRIFLSTEAAVREAIEAGRMKPAKEQEGAGA